MRFRRNLFRRNLLFLPTAAVTSPTCVSTPDDFDATPDGEDDDDDAVVETTAPVEVLLSLLLLLMLMLLPKVKGCHPSAFGSLMPSASTLLLPPLPSERGVRS